MGQCCTTHMRSEGEEKIAQIFSDSHFILKNLNHIKLLNNLVQYRIQQEIHKHILTEKMFPSLINKQPVPNPYSQQHSAFLAAVLDRLDDKNNIYKVYMLLYPFISHEDEVKPEETMFRYFKFITRNMTKKDLIDNLNNYITFVTKDITAKLIKIEEKESVIASFKEDIQLVYTDTNIMDFIHTLLGPSLISLQDNDEVDEQRYVNVFRKYNLQDYRSIRQYMMEKYSPR